MNKRERINSKTHTPQGRSWERNKVYMWGKSDDSEGRTERKREREDADDREDDERE